MTTDEWIYAILLLISVAFGFVFKKLQSSNAKRIVGSALGLAMVICVCRWHTLHSIVTVVINIFIIKTGGKRIHVYSFIWCFSYLLFFRTTHYLGLPKVPALSNAVQLLLTLKLIGLAFEISDSEILREQLKNNPENHDLQLRIKYESVNPSIWDMLCYSYCYIGLLTGPYFKYRTYMDMIYLKSGDIIIMPEILQRVRLGLACAVVFLATSKVYWISYATTQEFSGTSFLYKLWFMTIIFMWFRSRMYAAWLLSECVCIISCLGAYPAKSKPRSGRGPTNLAALEESCEKDHYDFETVHNIDVYGCEFSPTVRGGMRAWNKTVQYWLATYIYKRAPLKSLATTITMCVSAYWHGIHAGYYLSFMTIPLALMGEDLCAKSIKSRLSDNGQKIYDVIRWFFGMRELEYMCIGFLSLTYKDTISFWSSVYFINHIGIMAFIIVGAIAGTIMPRQKKVDSKES